MKKYIKNLSKAALMAATALVAVPVSAQQVTGLADFKLYLDPGHAGRENQGLWGYSEAEKVLRVALNVRDMLLKYTDINPENIKMCRQTDSDQISLEERSDEANAFGADFFYSIHSDAAAPKNTIVTLFGGWTVDGQNVEKTPNGGKAFGDFLEPNLKGVMRVESRGNRYDRSYYDPTSGTHENQYPYLSVNRRTNMASLLSEGGYHTIAEQQQRNMNKDYKRLEAFAAFQALLQYKGVQLPEQNFVTGMVSNSENKQPLNSAKITISCPSDASFAAREYLTDCYDSLFCKYTKNPELIHNGFFIFENLPKGKDLTIKYECAGFDTVEKTIRAAEGGATTADYVTFADIELTSNQPAKVASVSVSDLNAVQSIYPLTITFSRNMDRASVEKAFSINNDGKVSLSWENDYTLKVDVSELLPLWEYTITIDGSVAKNLQTGAFLDGDADGVAGGNYSLTFTMAEPDVTAPEVVSTYPAQEGEVVYATRPPIRIQFNEIIDWNSDRNDGWFEVKDSKGKTYTVGHVTHAIVGNASILHCYVTEDLTPDATVLVTLKPVTDLFGNTSEAFAFRFLTEHRAMASETMIRACEDFGTFWAPAGSGSTKGLCQEGNSNEILPDAPFHGASTSFSIKYAFDENTTDPYWMIREHDPDGPKTLMRDKAGVVTMWVYGDNSYNHTYLLFRDSASNGLVKKAQPMIVDFLGWNLFVWDLTNDMQANFTGEKPLGTKFYLDAIAIEHKVDTENPLEPEDEGYPQWSGHIGYNQMRFSKWTDATRTATINDIELPNTGVDAVKAAALKLDFNGTVATASAATAVNSIKVYALDGTTVASATPAATFATVDLSTLPAGVYMVQAATATAKETIKIVIR